MSTMRIERKKLRLRLASFCSEVEKKKRKKVKGASSLSTKVHSRHLMCILYCFAHLI